MEVAGEAADEELDGSWGDDAEDIQGNEDEGDDDGDLESPADGMRHLHPAHIITAPLYAQHVLIVHVESYHGCSLKKTGEDSLNCRL